MHWIFFAWAAQWLHPAWSSLLWSLQLRQEGFMFWSNFWSPQPLLHFKLDFFQNSYQHVNIIVLVLILFQTYNRGVCIFCPASLLQFEFPCQTLFGSIASNCSRFKPYRPCVSIPNLKLWGSLKEQNNSSPTSFDTIRSDIWQSNLGCSRVFSSSVQWPRQYHQAKSVAKGTNFILQSNGMAPERPKEEELPKLGLMLLASPWPLPTGAFLCPPLSISPLAIFWKFCPAS